jgi:hypothetical protein
MGGSSSMSEKLLAAAAPGLGSDIIGSKALEGFFVSVSGSAVAADITELGATGSAPAGASIILEPELEENPA